MDTEKIVYISYIDESILSSGSSVRHNTILKNLLKKYDVISLTGNQLTKKRKEKYKDVIKKVKQENIQFCYIESPTYPILKHYDRKLIKTIHRKKIPMGYFYRDFYRKFPNEFPRRKGFVNRLKELYLSFNQFLTDIVIKNCDIVYFPSEECKALFKYKKMDALPPACEKGLFKQKEANYVGIYVGGISEEYNVKLLFDVYDRLFEINKKYKLILICRSSEWEAMKDELGEREWLEVYHLKSSELSSKYKVASYALSPKAKTPYNEFAISYKTFEYMSYGLPQIVVNSRAIERFINNEKIGMAVNPNVDEFVSSIVELNENHHLYHELQNNIFCAIDNNSWSSRIEKIARDLKNLEG